MEISEDLKSDIISIKSKYEDSFYKDYNYLRDNYTKAMNIIEFLYSLSRDLSDNNINDKYDRFIEYIYNSNINIDDLYFLTNLINQGIYSEDINPIDRQFTLNIDSNFFVKCNEIISNKNILDNYQKQLLLERFILSYEKEFISNLIYNVDTNIKNYKLLARIYKHSTPHFNNRIDSIIRQHLMRNLELYNKNKKDYGKIGDNLALALFLVLEVKDISNILFSKVIRIIGSSKGIKQTELIGQLADEMCICFKYNSDLNKLKSQLSPEELSIVKEVKEQFNNLPVDSKLQFGHLLFELLISEFSYIFERIMISENNETHLYITISKEYLAVLSSVMFNPIKLPMITKPKIWSQDNIGGYLLDEFNELNKNNEIVRSNHYLKNQSRVSETQETTVNYLNSIPFEINETMLSYLIEEWNKENSIIFKNYNKLHHLSAYENDKLDSETKIEIIQHNSLYWNYSNIINIALLMKNNTIYLPTFLDFRGRIYPTPNYLNYQGSDIARSLLLFKNVGNKVNYDSTVNEILESFISKELILNKLNDIDYVKLYLSNVYGLNKLNRRNRIRWFDDNIDDILDLLNNNIKEFNDKYFIKAKEPAQFISTLFEYNKFIKKEIKEIKTPILFDATCSGVQHLSALTTDLDICKLVNLIEATKDEPSDFYNFCIKNILNNIENLPETDSLFKSKISKIDLSRKMLKHSIMTVPYNVTNIGIADKIAEYFDKEFISKDKAKELENKNLIILSKVENKDESNNENIKSGKKIKKESKGIYIFKPLYEHIKVKDQDQYKDKLIFTQSELNKLGNIIKQTVLSLIPPFTHLKKYFDEIIDILRILNLPIYWETPSNMSVSMSIMLMSQRKVRSKLIKSSKPITILIPTDNLDYESIKTGLMPNFIHSLDASNIHLLIEQILLLNIKNMNLYTIHDCFATDYKNMAILEILIKKSFSDIYFDENYLNKINESFLNQISAITTIFKEEDNGGKLGDNSSQFILIDPNFIKNKNNKIRIIKNNTYQNGLIKISLPKLPEYKWSVNKDIIKKEIMFNQYFIS
uniref:DNA-directed RNA polymerase n=1 Tax=Moniliophthora roreri (strain MCA 2997) TaxID=1381753 RepID=F2WVN7_MONRO|nr:rnapol [Moniliophthora roreri]